AHRGDELPRETKRLRWRGNAHPIRTDARIRLAPLPERLYSADGPADVGRWRLGPAQEGVANPVRSGRKQRYRLSSCAAGRPSRHRRTPVGGASAHRMTYQVLARRLRPQRFEDVVGQEHVTRTLRAAIAAARVAHPVPFPAPPGG